MKECIFSNCKKEIGGENILGNSNKSKKKLNNFKRGEEKREKFLEVRRNKINMKYAAEKYRIKY